MESQVQFPKFIAALKELGAPVGGAQFLADANASWASLPMRTRQDCLRKLAIPAAAAGVTLRLGKVPDAPKSLASILVIFEYSETIDLDAPAPPEPTPARKPKKTLPARPAPAPVATPAPEPQAAPRPEEPPAEALAQAPAAQTQTALDHEPDSAPEHEDAPENGSQTVPGHEDAPEPESAPEPEAAPEPEPAAAPVAPEASLVPAEAGGVKALFARFSAKQEAPQPETAWTGTVTEVGEPSDPSLEVVEVYAVQEPYAYIRILHDPAKHEHIYEVIEPALSDRERNILDFIENAIVDVIEVGLSAMTKEQAAAMLRKHVDEVIYDYSIVLNALSREKVLYYILRDFLGFGRLDPILRDDYIEDISCDAPRIPIFLYHRKYESIRSTVVFKEDHELDSFVIKMAQRSGKHVSIAEPLLDATLPDGSRLNATLSDEVTSKGSTFTIRKFREDPFTLPDLVRFGTMNEELLAYWWLAVQNGASAIYAGGTASGKTTSLNAILLFIPPQMKIVSIEDTREINIPHENWIAGITRAGFGPRDNNGRQAGEIDMFSLLKAALRQRPEYILVGEVRGQEATALFQAMATGHTAYGTMHADSTEAVIHRLESEPISIPRSLLEALDIVSIQIQTRIGGRRVRRTKELVEIVGLDPHTREILTNQVFTWSPATDEFDFSGVSYVLERIQIERNMSESDMRDEFDRRKRIIRWMVDNNVRDLGEVGRIIATYYRNPDAVMAMIEGEAVPEPSTALVPTENRPQALEVAAEEGDPSAQ